MDEKTHAFYSGAAPMTELPFDTCAQFLDDLPRDPAGAAATARGVLIHRDWAPLLGIQFDAGRLADQHLRPVREFVQRIVELVPAPLTTERPLPDRMCGICRHYATLHVALLRNAGIPARVRVGFAAYFAPTWEDHQITEWWDGTRWVRTDAQIGPVVMNALNLAFDPADQPPGQFLTAAEAWRECRAGNEDPQAFGIFDLRGLHYITGSMKQDLAAVNKVELLPWDDWGASDNDALFDELAELMVADELPALRARFAEPDVAVPAKITSYIDGRPTPVELDRTLLAVQ